jgi:membrane protein implicated in regulation of membrane protease activity
MTVFASFMALQSLIGVIVKVVILFLIIAAGIMIATWIAMYFNPALFVLLILPMTLATVTFGLVAVVVTYILIVANGVLHMNNHSKVPGVPSRPSCVVPEQWLTMYDLSKKQIQEIQVGDRLWPDNRVTAVLCLNGWGSTLYNLDNIQVSGTHRVLYKDKWIYVKDHPDAERCVISRTSLLYCLNTESKRIEMGQYVFCDWDEIFDKEKDQRHLFSLMPETKRENRYIHEFFDRGWSGDTLVEMEYGVKKEIRNVEIGDKLEGGFVVEGTVKIGTDLAKMYHLLTDHAFFVLDGQLYEDYNSCIESNL